MSSDYFTALYQESSEFIEHLALPPVALPLAELLATTKPVVETCSAEAARGMRGLRQHLQPVLPMAASVPAPVGLNTVGFLCDRLTVLAMKEWVLRQRLHAEDKALVLRRTQIMELIDALAEARPGHSSFAQKLSVVEAEATAATWEDAYCGLLSVNILLWEAQEVLYAGQIGKLECSELRRYIAWFSEGNVRRNNYIALCETLFWQMRTPSQP